MPEGRINALWWGMGTAAGKPAMQIVGDFQATNTSHYAIRICGMNFIRPRNVEVLLQMVTLEDAKTGMHSSKNFIPKRAIGELRMMFFIAPPICHDGEPLVADISFIDQFNNEHVLKDLRFTNEAWRRGASDAVGLFERALRSGDRQALVSSMVAIDEASAAWGTWQAALRRVPHTVVHAETRKFFVELWIHYGEHIRQEVNDDLLLGIALKVLLPPYEGPAMRLYRGEGAYNRKYRKYGMSWSSDVAVAEKFATGIWRTFEGGSAVTL